MEHWSGINKPKCVFRMTWSAINEFLQFLKIIYFSKFSAASLPFCLTACLPACQIRSFKCSRRLATATALLLWQKCLEFHGKKKPFTILNVYVHALLSYSFSFDPSLLFSMVSIKGYAQVSCITL